MLISFFPIINYRFEKNQFFSIIEFGHRYLGMSRLLCNVPHATRERLVPACQLPICWGAGGQEWEGRHTSVGARCQRRVSAAAAGWRLGR